MGGELTVYFIDHQDEEYAKQLARFWKNNDLLTGKDQDIQLIRSDDGYRLNIIADNPDKVKPIALDELQALLSLQNMLNDSIFVEKSVQIVICNNRFKPILNINQ